MTAVLAIEGVAILLLAVLVVGLLRNNAEILRALHQLGVTEDGWNEFAPSRFQPTQRLNDDAPADVVGTTLQGAAAHIGVAGSDTNTLLAFLSSGCSACINLWETIEEENPGSSLRDTRFVVVTKGEEAESRSRLLRLAPPATKVLQSTEAWESYGVPVTPYFVLVEGQTGTIVGEGSAATWSQVESLIGQALADRGAEDASANGTSEFLADSALRKAGIAPGDPSLYPKTPPTEDQR